MFITFKNNLYKPYWREKVDIVDIAIFRIHFYKMKATEKQLDMFLKQHYGKGLKAICKNLVKTKLKINWDPADNNMIITFKDEKSNNLADLITYGNEHTLGSAILRFALNQEF